MFDGLYFHVCHMTSLETVWQFGCSLWGSCSSPFVSWDVMWTELTALIIQKDYLALVLSDGSCKHTVQAQPPENILTGQTCLRTLLVVNSKNSSDHHVEGA